MTLEEGEGEQIQQYHPLKRNVRDIEPGEEPFKLCVAEGEVPGEAGDFGVADIYVRRSTG